MFYSLGDFAYRRRWAVLFVWAIVLLVGLPLLPGATSRLQFGGFTSPRMESSRAEELMKQELPVQSGSLVVLFSSPTLSAEDPEFSRRVDYALSDLSGTPEVDHVVVPRMNPRQISGDGHTAYALVVLKTDAETAARQVSRITDRLRNPAEAPGGSGAGSDMTMSVTGGPVLFAEVERLSHEDLQRAEVVAFPFAALALLAVFGSLVATGLPIALGGASVVAILASVALMSRATELSIFVVNVATMLGLGLGVDYSLFMTSRFREEIRHRPVRESVAVTTATAGKAVFFSGLSVFIGLAGLSTFEFNMLHSVGVVGMVGIAICVIAALTLLPAILGILGHNVNRLPVPTGRLGPRGFWERSAAWVMRHPVLVFVPTLVLLVALGIPFLHVRFSAPDANILPPHLESRQALDQLRREFGESETAPVLVVAQMEGGPLRQENISRLYDFTHALAADPRVSEVESIVDLDPRITKAQYQLIYADPARISDFYAQRLAQLSAGQSIALVKISTRASPVSEEAKGFVRDLRSMALPEGMRILVGGTSAQVADVVDVLYADVPGALAFVVAAIYLVLLLLFRSVLLPAKAIVMNTLSILASYGALVYIFQDGHFQSLLGFQATGYTEASMPVIMFSILFGLSMDYEVFLLTRIKEEYERTGDNRVSVAKGLERSGKIITSAAIIVVVVGGAFAAADIMTIKSLGLGIAIAVFLDATVVRTLLVPATMRLLGDLNWWMPGWLDRILPRQGESDWLPHPAGQATSAPGHQETRT